MEEVDAVVVGASIRGLVTTYILSQLGYKAVLIERGAAIGGGDGSFLTPGGSRFDIGMHVLDSMRSEIATRLFTHVLDGEVHRTRLKRAIVLQGEVIPYAPLPTEMPEKLRAMLPSEPLVDDLGDDLPTRERLARCYGQSFTDMIFDEVLPSYRCEARHLEFGVDESHLLDNIYPWFFPRATRRSKAGDQSRSFHDKLRAGIEQDILYPKQGGFGGFANAFLRHFDKSRIEVITHAGDLQIEVEPGSHHATSVSALGRQFRAKHYFWGASWDALCSELDIPCQKVASDCIVLGSFRLNSPARCEYHEVLVGDPREPINRIHFPARFRGSNDPLMQVEFAFPKLEDWSLTEEYWQSAWLESLLRLGILERHHRVEEFDFKTVYRHFNSYGVEGEALIDADASAIHANSNIHPVAPSMANLNLNAHLPLSIRTVTAILTNSPPT